MAGRHNLLGTLYLNTISYDEDHRIELDPYNTTLIFRDATLVNTLALQLVTDSGHLDLRVQSNGAPGVIIHGDPNEANAIFTVPEITQVSAVNPTGIISYDSSGRVASFTDTTGIVGFTNGSLASYDAGTNIVLDPNTRTIRTADNVTFSTITAQTVTASTRVVTPLVNSTTIDNSGNISTTSLNSSTSNTGTTTTSSITNTGNLSTGGIFTVDGPIAGFTTITDNTYSTRNTDAGTDQVVTVTSAGVTPGIIIRDRDTGGIQREWSIITTPDTGHTDLEFRYQGVTVVEYHDPATNNNIAVTIPTLPSSIITPTRIAVTDTSGNIGSVALGSNLSFTGGTLSATFSDANPTFNTITTSQLRQTGAGSDVITDPGITNPSILYFSTVVDRILTAPAGNQPPYDQGSRIFTFTGVPDSAYNIEVVSVARSQDNRSDAQRKGFHFRQLPSGIYTVDDFTPVGSVAGTLAIDTVPFIPNTSQPTIQIFGNFSTPGSVRWIARIDILRSTL